MLYYYGTLMLGELYDQVERLTGKSESRFDYFEVTREAEAFYREIQIEGADCSYWRVMDPDQVKREHAMRASLPFYPFTKGQLLLAGEPGFVDRNPSYRAFVDFIVRTYRMPKAEADSLVEECVYAIRCGEMPGDVLAFLQEHLEMDDMGLIESFMGHIVTLHNNTKEWLLKGWAPHEISAERNRSAVLPFPAKGQLIDFATRKTVGRNDPCPCGSGLKYKKCCGK